MIAFADATVNTTELVNAAPSAVIITSVLTTLTENTSTASHIKIADILQLLMMRSVHTFWA